MSLELSVENVSKSFDGLVAVDRCSLRAEKGEITGLIGPNGAGKSTLFNMVAGLLRPDEGRVRLGDEDVTGLKPQALYRRGLLRTFQIAHEFSSMTALENLMAAAAGQTGERLWNVWFKTAAVRRAEALLREKAEEALEFLHLSHVRDEKAGNLSGGQKKLLELGRTMLADGKFVLLDEVAAGVNRTLLKGLMENIEYLNQERGVTFFIIEHDIDLVSRLCSHVIVMAEGRVMKEGTPDEIKSDPEVIEAYFGGAPLGKS